MQDRERKMTTVTIGCAVVNIVLTIAKIIAGLFGKSAAMMADAVHSLSDVVADGVVLLMVRISAKGKDERYNWGRGKYEAVATIAISLLLIVIAADMMADGIESIKEVLTGGEIQKPGNIALWVAVISIVLQEAVFRWTVHVGKSVESQTMIANAWHHRSDALASVATLIGIGGAIFLGGKWTMLDPLVGCIISIVILVIAVKMFLPALKELTDCALPEKRIEDISAAVLSVNGVEGISDIATRQSGHCNVIEVTIEVAPDMSVTDADSIGKAVKEALTELLGPDTIATVQIVPKQ